MNEVANIQNNDAKAQDENVPLLFNIPVGVSSRYAHHLLVQVGGDEVTFSFFEMIPPVVLDAKLLENGVRADCVARVTIAKARFPDFVKTLVDVLQKSKVEE